MHYSALKGGEKVLTWSLDSPDWTIPEEDPESRCVIDSFKQPMSDVHHRGPLKGVSAFGESEYSQGGQTLQTGPFWKTPVDLVVTQAPNLSSE